MAPWVGDVAMMSAARCQSVYATRPSGEPRPTGSDRGPSGPRRAGQRPPAPDPDRYQRRPGASGVRSSSAVSAPCRTAATRSSSFRERRHRTGRRRSCCRPATSQRWRRAGSRRGSLPVRWCRCHGGVVDSSRGRVRIRWTRQGRCGWSSCAGCIKAGVPIGCGIGWSRRAWIRCRAGRRSAGRWSGSVWSVRGGGAGRPVVTPRAPSPSEPGQPIPFSKKRPCRRRRARRLPPARRPAQTRPGAPPSAVCTARSARHAAASDGVRGGGPCRAERRRTTSPGRGPCSRPPCATTAVSDRSPPRSPAPWAVMR
jgi:hypothetical protein